MELSEFFFKYGISTTTNFDLKDIANMLSMKIKVLMKDEIKDCKTSFQNAIINFQNSNQSGTHWVALSNTDKLCYFDSYGIPPLNEVEDFAELNKKDLMYNTIQIQPNNSKMCGQLCLYFLYLTNIEEYEFEDAILKMYEELEELLN